MKRFTETDKWKNRWFRSLVPTMKIAWIYLCDNCDKSGVWEPDFDVADIQIGEKIDWNDVRIALGDRLEELENGKWFIKEFIDFQYGTLSETCHPHKSIIKLMEYHKVLDRVPSRVPSRVLSTLEDKDKDKDKDKDSSCEIIDYLNLKAGTKFRPVKVNIDFIHARLKEGATVGDIKSVIDLKCKDWIGKPESKYLRPETLFNATKFNSYLGLAGQVQVKQSLKDDPFWK